MRITQDNIVSDLYGTEYIDRNLRYLIEDLAEGFSIKFYRSNRIFTKTIPLDIYIEQKHIFNCKVLIGSEWEHFNMCQTWLNRFEWEEIYLPDNERTYKTTIYLRKSDIAKDKLKLINN